MRRMAEGGFGIWFDIIGFDDFNDMAALGMGMGWNG